jgi:hypothetical protein
MPTNGRPAAIDLPDYGSFLVEEVEIPGFSAFYYETSYELEGRSVDLVLHPPEDENSDWTDFLAYAHQMIGDVLQNSDSIILSGSRATRRLFRKYGELWILPSRFRKIVAEFHPKMVMINATRQHEMMISDLELFPSFDLFLEFDDDLQVRSARFDG